MPSKKKPKIETEIGPELHVVEAMVWRSVFILGALFVVVVGLLIAAIAAMG